MALAGTESQRRDIRARLFHTVRTMPDSDIVRRISGGTEPLPSDQAIERYRGLTSVPAYREFHGERRVKSLEELGFDVVNEPFELTLGMTQAELDRDKTGQIAARRAAGMRNRKAQLWERLAIKKIKEGEAATCYDGQFFFDTDHQEGGSGAQNNDLTHNVTTPTAPTVDEMRDALFVGLNALADFTDDEGEPANMDVDRVIVLAPRTFRQSLLGAIAAPFATGGETNILRLEDSSFSIWTPTRIGLTDATGAAWTDKFAIFIDGGASLLRQVEIDNELTELGRGSDEYHKRRRVEYGSYTSIGINYEQWRNAVLVTLT